MKDGIRTRAAVWPPGFQAVEKAFRAFPTKGFHDGCSAAAVMRSVISEAHVPENDGFYFFPAMRGGNSAKLFNC